MKGLLLVLVVGAVMAVAAGSALAADEAAAPKAPAKAGIKAGINLQLDQINLSDEQKEQIKAIIQTAREQAQAATDIQAKLQIFADAVEKIRTTVLTDDQRAKLEGIKSDIVGQIQVKLQGIAQQSGMTEEQIAAAKAIMQAAAEEAKNAPDLQAKLQIFKDAMEKIRTTVLTEEQRAKMQQSEEQIKQKMEQLREKMKARRGQESSAPAAAPQA
jgi:hypothetical protein